MSRNLTNIDWEKIAIQMIFHVMIFCLIPSINCLFLFAVFPFNFGDSAGHVSCRILSLFTHFAANILFSLMLLFS